MTAAHIQPALTLEAEAEQQAARWSRTALERVDIVTTLGRLLNRYALAGGRNPHKWLMDRGFAHGTASNVLNASRALNRGLTSSSVSELADMGQLLKAGKTPSEVTELQEQKATRKAATLQAGIGLGSVRYPVDSAEEMARVYLEIQRVYLTAGLDVPDLPELTLMLARVARRHLGDVLTLEGEQS